MPAAPLTPPPPAPAPVAPGAPAAPGASAPPEGEHHTDEGFLPAQVGALPWEATTGRLTVAAVRAALREAVRDATQAARSLGHRPFVVLAVALLGAVVGTAVTLRGAQALAWGAAAWSFIAPLAVIAGLRAGDVTLNVFKTTCVIQGRRAAAGVFAFAEALVWVTAAGIVLVQFTPVRAVAFALGVGGGTWLGMAVVHRLRLGLVTVRMFVPLGPGREQAGRRAADRIRELGYGATLFSGEGMRGSVAMVLAVARRREVAEICTAVQAHDRAVLITIDNQPGPGSVVAGVQGPTA